MDGWNVKNTMLSLEEHEGVVRSQTIFAVDGGGMLEVIQIGSICTRWLFVIKMFKIMKIQLFHGSLFLFSPFPSCKLFALGMFQ